jgi:Carboxypeptidase regulatory-like domain/TonB-dependent Receptor Plug Domain/TonB dependent receptor
MSLKIRGVFGVVLVTALGVLLFTPVHAQVAGGTVLGTVKDPSGAVVAGAQVTITDIATGVSRVVPTDGSGSYSSANFLPGTYSITVTAPGFATEVRSDIDVTVGSQVLINLKLKPGATQERIEVKGTTSGVELTTSTISDQVGSRTITDLPLNGRDWTLLATLSPGVVSLEAIQPSTGGSASGGRGNRGFGTELTISGSRPQQSSYRVDGINVNDWLNGGPGSVLGATAGVDSVEEFSVLTSNYSAEYGRTSGGVINAITHSGTNRFHGTAYEFLRNSALDAENFFDTKKVPFRRNQFGGSIGGPIQKDRTFFFANYEGIRQSLGITNVDVVPSQAARQGNIHDSNGNPIVVTVDPLVAPFLGLWSMPNAGSLGNGDLGTYKFAAQAVTNGNFLTGRIDQTITSADSIFGTYQFDKGLTTLPDALGDIQVGQKRGRQLLVVEERHIFNPQLINSFRVGVNRVTVDGGYANADLNPIADSPALQAVPGFTAPQIAVAGITTFQGGLKNYGFTKAGYTSYQAYDDAFLARGKHILKFGFAFERMYTSVIQDNTDGGQYSFGSLQNFLTNVPQTLEAGLLAEHSPRDYRQNIFGLYLQDDFRWKPNFTLNLGLRYEVSSTPTEAHGKLSNMRSLTATAPHLGDPFFQNPTLRNFEPRVGFAWDPFGNEKTAIRGGFGIFDVLPLVYQYGLTAFSSAPFTEQGRATVLPPGSFPTEAFSLVQALSLLREGYIQYNLKRNYVMEWNVNVQRQLAPDLTATIAYVGSRGKHMLFRGDDANMVLPTALTPSGYLWPNPAINPNPSVINPNFGRIDYTDWNSSSYYDSLQLQVRKEMTHGFQVQGSFTWSKSIDTGSMGDVGDPFNSSISNLFFFDRSLSRAVSDYDIPYNAIINALWNAPVVKSLHGPASWISNGWQLGAIFNIHGGLPFTPLDGGDPLGTLDNSPYAYPSRLKGPGCQTGVNPGNPFQYIKLQCFTPPEAPNMAFYNANCNPAAAFPTCLNLLGNARRNSLRGPRLTDLDFSVFKNNYIRSISETFNIQFRAELFNVFNHPNFLPPLDNNTLFDQNGAPVGGAGLIDGTSTTARQVQFALKVIF